MADKKDNNDPCKEEPNNNNGDFVEPSDEAHLPDSEQVATEWGNLEDDIPEEPVVDDGNPFAN